MNWPNILTLSRIFLTFFFVVLLLQSSLIAAILAVLVFTIASLTDFWDGQLAKKYYLVSDFGKIMDPIADKVLMLSAFGAFAYMGMVSLWMVEVIALREVLVTASRLLAMRQGQVLAAEKAGKIKTVVQIIVIFIILGFLVTERLPSANPWFYRVEGAWLAIIYVGMAVAVFLTVVSGAQYFWAKWKNGKN